MVSVDEAVIARLESHGLKFEILVDPDKAYSFKKGKDIPLDEILAARGIFKDASSGEEPPEEDIKKVFKTTNVEEVAKSILKKGNIQLTTKQKQEMTEEKKKQVISIIVKRAADPEGRPHPPARIENAMNEAKIHIDPFISADEQAKKVIDAIKPIIPISIQNVKIAVKIPAQYTGKAYGIVKEFGKLENEEWQADGSLLALVEMPAGLQTNFYDRLNKATQGDVETKIMKS